MSLGELESELPKQDNDLRFCTILRAALEDLPKKILNKFHKNNKPLRCFLSLFPIHEDVDPEHITLGTVEFDKENHISLIFDYASVNHLSDDAVRGLIGRLIAVAYLGRCTDEEADKHAINWGFKRGLDALAEELKPFATECN